VPVSFRNFFFAKINARAFRAAPDNDSLNPSGLIENERIQTVSPVININLAVRSASQFLGIFAHDS
jgi:hypothetical protein